ncbi:MAG: zinc-binding alcohol dehydrogenase [Lentisphaeria bacterium]|nr:zinc-binding alcohol dehydrogenase [Lentisphaeria bacterium]
MKTKAIMFVAEGKAEFRDFERDVTLQPDWILLKTECTLISPGTEFACLQNTPNQVGAPGFPKILGYSAVARVLQTGSAVTSVREGDRCLCYHSCHCNYQIIPECNLVKIEDDRLPAEEAVFCVVGCMGFQGVRRCRPEFGESLMVMGLGLLGQFAVQTARLSGCFPVIGLDFIEARRDIARTLGADAVFSPDDPDLRKQIMELTSGRGCDSVVEITGNPQAVVQGLGLTAPFGRFSLTGCNRKPTEKIDFYNLVHRPGISVIGAHNMARPQHDRRPGVWTMKEDMALLLRYLSAGRVHSRELLTMVADPSEAPGIYDRLYARDPGLLGVVFDWKNY